MTFRSVARGKYNKQRLRDPQRLDALRRSALLDAPPQEAFDRLTRLASRVLGAPVSLVSLVDTDRQFFLSEHGLADPWASERETPLSHSFCQHVVTTGDELVIDDARKHELVKDNLAVDELGVIAYAGVPLSDRAGNGLGSFCVIEPEARRWTKDDLQTLRDLADAVMTEFDLREALAGERARAAALEYATRRARRIVESAHEAFIEVDELGEVTDWNGEAERMFGYARSEALGHLLASLIIPEHLRGDYMDDLAGFLTGGASSMIGRRLENVAVDRDENQLPVEFTVTAIDHDDGWSFHAFVRDITDRLRYQEELQRLADRDALTGLFNRRRFDQELERALMHADRYSRSGALLALDLDGFKQVNDTYGHAGGDRLIEHFARTLTARLRETDVIARVGGDEFGVLLPEATAHDARTVAAKILRALATSPVELSDEHHAHVNVSIGIAAWDGAAVPTATTLTADADTAMYTAKTSGRNRFAIYQR